MSQTFNSKSDPVWLKDSHQKRTNRSVELGKAAIDLLINKGIPVTYSKVANHSKEIDTEGKGIHPNTIRTNQELYEYYKQHSKTYKQKSNTPNGAVPLDNFEFYRIKPNRNLDNIQRKYMKLTKKELVQRLILAEEHIAENNTKWVANHFESFK